jgi:hypothetical protein
MTESTTSPHPSVSDDSRKRKRDGSDAKKKKSKRSKHSSKAGGPDEPEPAAKSLLAQSWDAAAEAELKTESETDRIGWPHLDPSTLFDASRFDSKPDAANALVRAVSKKLQIPYYTDVRDAISEGKLVYVEQKIGEKERFVLRNTDAPKRPVRVLTPFVYVSQADFRSFDDADNIKKNKRKFVLSECPVSFPQESAPPGATHPSEARTRNVAVVDFFDNVLNKIPDIVGMARALEGDELAGPRQTELDVLRATADATGRKDPDPLTAEAVVARAKKKNMLRSPIFSMKNPDDKKGEAPGIPPNKLRFASFASRAFWEVKRQPGENGAPGTFPECKRRFVKNHAMFNRIYEECHQEFIEMPIVVFDKKTKGMVTTDPLKFHYPEPGQPRSIVKGDVVFFEGELGWNNDPAGGGRAAFEIKRVFKLGFNIKGAEGTMEVNTDLASLDDDLFDALPDAEEDVNGATAYRDATAQRALVHKTEALD